MKASTGEGVHRIGVISDTHGLMRPEALAALAGVEMILHAGDVGEPEILSALAAIASVEAVRGNVDHGAWAEALPMSTACTIGGAAIYMLHDRAALDLDPEAAGFAAVITGHSHVPLVERIGGVLYLNPGSAGRRRFTHPISLAIMTIAGGRADAELITLDA